MRRFNLKKTGILTIILLSGFAFPQSALALSPGDVYRIHGPITAYEDSFSAQQKTDDSGTRPPGTYYVYKTFNGMLNVSTQQNAPGFWIDPSDNSAPSRTMVTAYRVNLRSGPSRHSDWLGILPPGTAVRVSDTSKGYARIRWNESDVYVYSDYLASIKEDPFQKLILEGRVNFRSGPGTAYPSYGKLPQGTVVRNLGNSDHGFIQVNHGGTAGWISAGYIDAKEPMLWQDVLIVSKTYPVPKAFKPTDPADEAASQLKAMKAALKAQTGRDLDLISGYRSYWSQQRIYREYVLKNGYDAASMYSARPGHSEHQTGLAFDLNGADPTTILKQRFRDTPEYRWMDANAHKYGFILRYPENQTDVTGYIFEPWHYRYVGVRLATDMKRFGATLEEYTGLD